MNTQCAGTCLQRICILLIFFFSALLLRAQEKITDTAEVYRLIETADKMNQMNQIDSAEFYYMKAGQLAEALKFDNGYLEYTGKYTGFLYRQVRYQEALEIARKQYEVGVKTDNKRKTANALNNIAVQYQAIGNMQEAAKSLIQALEISASLNDVANLQKYNTNLASLFIDLKDYKKGLLYARRSYDFARQLNDTMVIGRSLVNLLVAETYSGNLEEAVISAEKVLHIGEKYDDIDLIMTAYCNLGDLYLRKNEYNKGLEYFKLAVPLLVKSPPDYGPYVYNGIATSYKHLAKYKEADLYFNKAYAQAETYWPQAELVSLLLSGSEIKEANGNYSEALLLRKRQQSLKDSLLNQDNQRTVHELEIQYQTAKKEAILAENELQLAQQQHEIDKRTKWIIGVSLIVLLLVSMLVFNYKINQQKQRTVETDHKNKLLKAQLSGEEEERSRTARELHDGVASVLSAAKLQLNFLNTQDAHQEKNDKAQLQHLIELSLQEVRNISHNLAAEIVLSEGLGYAVKEFCNRVSNPELQIEYYQMGEMPDISKSDQLLIYRIIQEAVTNIVKHAEASEAIVQLQTEMNKLNITIEDNGKGFDKENLNASGIGLRSLVSRVQLLNGNYEIQSAPGKGTTIFIDCTFKKEAII